MVGASVLGTVTANMADSEVPSDPEFTQTMHIGEHALTAQGSVGMQDILPGQGGLSLPGARLDVLHVASATELVGRGRETLYVAEAQQDEIELKAQLMKWAVLFDADPAARETLDAELGIGKATEAVKKLLADGWTVDDIVLHGFASDEDDTAWNNGGENPGFGIDSVKNVRLAKKRARAVAGLLRAKLSKKIDPSIANLVHVDGGTEVQDDDLAKAITDLAADHHMTAQELVVQYNRDRNAFSADDLQILDGLRDDRYVQIKITVSRDIVKTVHVFEEGEWQEKEETSKEVSLVFVPILIPIVRRKSKEVTPGPLPPRPPQPREPQIGKQRRLFDEPIVRERRGYADVAKSRKQPTTHNTSYGNFRRNSGVPVNRSGRGRPA